MEPVDDTTRNKLVTPFTNEQHSLLFSVGLHLIPGVLILIAYLLVAAPFVRSIGYPPYLAWVLAMCLALVPAELGLLLYLGWQQNGKLSLRGIVHYQEKPVKRGTLIGLVIALVIWLFIASAILTPVDSVLYEHLFFWIPFERTGGAGGYVAGYPRSTVIITLVASLLLTGIILPVVEELYFRGYLLPRLSHLGKWAPILNVTLFSLYHLWTPWQFVSRIGFFLPTVWVTWRKEDLRISLWVHCLSNTITQLLTLIAILLGASF